MPAVSLARRLSLDAGSLTWRVGAGSIGSGRPFSDSPLPVSSGRSPPPATRRRTSPPSVRGREPGPGPGWPSSAARRWAASSPKRPPAPASRSTSTLALDPETLEVVTLGLEGPPVRHSIESFRHPWRRDEALGTCRRVGRAVASSRGWLTPESGARPGPSLAGDRAQTRGGRVPCCRTRTGKAWRQSLSGLFETATGEPGGDDPGPR